MSPVSRRTVLAGTAAAATVAAVSAAAPATAGGTARIKPTIVLVHGAFADAAGWSGVLKRLIRAGYPVLAPANPLRGVDSDSAYLASVLATIAGPIVLVGHSYGGVVITNAATGNPNVKALVYVAAFAPDAGDTVLHLQTLHEGTKLTLDALDFRPYPGDHIDGYVKRDVFREVFAGDLSREEADLLWATQRPGDGSTLQTASGEPGWKTIPSYYLVARNDNLIPAAAQRFMAARAKARTVEVSASHVAHISQPRVLADLIEKAAR
ncbi:alpha/beta hydrolase [Actinoplanes lobatus]|uniref:Alpha/beta hydrolase n=1 Tax=Actinoplanes lobatus TaxID=113568 RepID=A0A7W7HMC9_9ACTN|nr:alpha/beta hydrolase [Actinoplanes lobatus]MBB4753204.1 pimeloyl-ACP methyl ester carboxylesterase [Actinoplanes lobatus]GGN59110.1 alpha/beta hydrolase [Actinoplanes lobatus]GIE42936.1 alpha/beta hydrolase [Actinoplanes lobatus]